MLLANMTVARRLLEKFPLGAMLRRHPSPRTSVLMDLVNEYIFAYIDCKNQQNPSFLLFPFSIFHLD